MENTFLNNFDHEFFKDYELWLKDSIGYRVLILYDNSSNIFGYCRSNLWDRDEIKDELIRFIEQFKQSREWISWDSGIDQLINMVPLSIKRRTVMLISLTNGLNALIISKEPIYQPSIIFKPGNSYIISGKDRVDDFEKFFKLKLKYKVLHEAGIYVLYLVTGGV